MRVAMKEKKRYYLFEITWIFTIGAFLGYLVETLWHLIKYHEYINKQGLLYGPFKPIYGLGAVLITIIFSKVRKDNYIKTFCLGTILGTIYEYLCSAFQEYVFKTSTWSYEKFNWNLNGRIYLPYCLAWGIICILWINYLYPFLKKYLNQINQKTYRYLSIILTIFMAINIILTTTAVIRTSIRNRSDKTTYVFRFIDDYYSNEYMHRKFPKMEFLEK